MPSSPSTDTKSPEIARNDTSSPSRPLLGGPGTLLPKPIESLLSWGLALSCLSISGYHYMVSTILTPMFTRWISTRSSLNDAPSFHDCWIPLTTHSREELRRGSPRERLDQLVRMLRLSGISISGDDDDAALVRILRTNEVCRRLASLAMRPYEKLDRTKDYNGVSESCLTSKLATIWPRLLTLPPLRSSRDASVKIAISLILPLFRENGDDVIRKLKHANRFCVDPSRVQVILVDAGGCTDIHVLTSFLGEGADHATERPWGEASLVRFTSGGGRGPCLNFGAEQASGLVLTFCHSDTALPPDWDRLVLHALDEPRARSNSCAFSFGIDTTSEGLNGGPYPPGIRAVETTANFRSRTYSLPYGDQVISVPASIFRFLGGFPDQCLMEDYELVGMLRKRAALMPRVVGNNEPGERLTIIHQKAMCSPRRWQKWGVLYVTFMNSKFVTLYAGGLSADDLFRLYYGGHPPKREADCSPWEVELGITLGDTLGSETLTF